MNRQRLDVFRASARLAILALPIAVGAILWTWWSTRDASEPVPRWIEPGLVSDPANPTSNSQPQDLDDFVSGAARVGLAGEACSVERPDRPNLLVEVTDPSGQPLPNALVSRWDTHGGERLPDSGPDGRVETAIPECTGQSVVIRANGFAAAYRELGDRFPVRLEVRLSRERTLTGRVVDVQGVPLAGMTVLGWPSHRRPSSLEVARSANASWMFPRATTGPEGRFVLQGLDHAAAYALVAGGDGHVLVDPMVVEPAAAAAIEIRLWRLHALRWNVQTLGGGTLVVPEVVGTSGCTSLRHRSDRTYRFIDPASPQVALTTPLRERALRGHEYSLNETLLLYAAPDVQDRLGPIHYRFCAPGYAPAEGDLWIPFQAGAEVAESTLSLEQVVPLFGPLEVRVHGAPQGIGPLHTASGPPLLVFARNAQANCEYFFPIPDNATSRLDGLLPTGTTEFVLAEAEWQQPDWSVVLAELDLTDGPNVLDLDLSGLGGVEFDLFDLVGEPVLGPVRVELRSGAGGVLRHLDFHRAPYRIYGLEGGEYSLTIHQPYGPRGDSAHSEVFRVEPGRFVRTQCLAGDVKGR